MYILPDRFIQVETCCLAQLKQHMPKRFGNGTKHHTIEKTFSLNDYVFSAELTLFSSEALYWMKQLFINETNFNKSGCSLSNEFFLILSGMEVFG